MPERLPGLPRPRTIIHPGPVGAVRIEHRRAERGRHFRLSLPQGRSLYEALVEALTSVLVQNASMTLLDGDLDALSFCLALPDDNAHSPNEKFDLDIFAQGQRMGALLWQELAK